MTEYFKHTVLRFFIEKMLLTEILCPKSALLATLGIQSGCMAEQSAKRTTRLVKQGRPPPGLALDSLN